MNRGMNVATDQHNDWRTPGWLFRLLHERFQFTVDAAADASNALLPRYWDIQADGLQQSWKNERVFFNPPFDKKDLWAKKAATSNADIAVGILPATIEQRWFHEWVLDHRARVIVPRGRVAYDPAPGVPNSTPRFASVIVVYSYIQPQESVWVSGKDDISPQIGLPLGV